MNFVLITSSTKLTSVWVILLSLVSMTSSSCNFVNCPPFLHRLIQQHAHEVLVSHPV